MCSKHTLTLHTCRSEIFVLCKHFCLYAVVNGFNIFAIPFDNLLITNLVKVYVVLVYHKIASSLLTLFVVLVVVK